MIELTLRRIYTIANHYSLLGVVELRRIRRMIQEAIPADRVKT